MPNRTFKPVYGLMLAFGMAGPALTQDNGPTQHNGGLPPSAREQLSHIHTPHSIDQELVRLTKDLELAPEQQSRVRALLDENPNASRQELGPRIHAISDETHREIHALLSDRKR
jgi:hypothetical protein